MVKVGTRASKLALLQTELVKERFQQHNKKTPVEVVQINTGGDKNRSVPISRIGGTGVFVKELEEALLNKSVDFVVHSLKDMPTESPEGLRIAAVLNRMDPRDVLLSRNKISLKELKPGSKIATSSRRRLAQLKSLRNDLEFIDMRGNVPTRVKKMEDGFCDAIILAAAGLIRLGMEEHITEYLGEEQCTAAAGQGALAIQCRADDQDLIAALTKLDEPMVNKEITAERAFLKVLGGGCSVPIGARAVYQEDYGNLTLSACVASLDGSRVVRLKLSSDDDSPEQLGVRLAEMMLKTEARDILKELKESEPNLISPP